MRIIAEIDNCKFQFVNIYGPNPINLHESEFFFNSIENFLEPDIKPIIFGDFNMVEDIFKDRKGGKAKVRHTYGIKALNDLKTGHDLVDIWRAKYPNKKEFTWHSKNQQIHSRLDRLYIPNNYVPLVSSTFIQHFVWSDHSVCGIKMKLPSLKQKGKGYWKLNIQYLEHERYKNKIETFWKEWKRKIQDYEDLSLWWDCGKIYLKSISVQYAQEIHKIRKNKKYSLLEELKTEREKSNVDPQKVENIEQQLLEIEREVNQKNFYSYTHYDQRNQRRTN